MDNFTVPKFIEEKPKVVGPLTFRQFLFVGTAAGICLILYFTVPLHIFLICGVILLTGSFFLAFGKVNGIPIIMVIKNFFVFLSAPKIYLWKRKVLPPKFVEKAAKPPEKEDKKDVPRIAEKSQLRDLSTRIETGVK